MLNHSCELENRAIFFVTLQKNFASLITEYYFPLYGLKVHLKNVIEYLTTSLDKVTSGRCCYFFF